MAAKEEALAYHVAQPVHCDDWTAVKVGIAAPHRFSIASEIVPAHGGD
jgi:hypothetical protein